MKTSKNKYVDVEQKNIKMNISANTMSTKAHISTKKSNLTDNATKSSSNNFLTCTSTDLNNTADISNQNIQHIENYQDATFPKGLYIIFYIMRIYTASIYFN